MNHHAAYLLARLGLDAAPEAPEALGPEATALVQAIARRLAAGDVWQRSADTPLPPQED